MPAIFFNFSRTRPGLPNRAGRFLGNRRSKNSNQICVALDTVQDGRWSSIESESTMTIFGPMVSNGGMTQKNAMALDHGTSTQGGNHLKQIIEGV